MKSKLLDVIGIVLFAAGVFLAFLPHAIHAAVGLAENTHLTHEITGMVMLVIGLGVLIYNNDALRKFGKS